MSLLTGQPTSWEKRDSPMADTERYWNPVLETLPAARLRELQFRKFKRIVSWAYERSPFYRSVYDESGFRPDMLQTFADIPRVPKVEKSMLRGAQEDKEPHPYGDLLAVPLRELPRFGRPLARPAVPSTRGIPGRTGTCLLYTSDAADDLLCVDLGGRR